MSNIPTLVISPYFQGCSIHYTASMWEAQSDSKPMIRPLFSVPCPIEYIDSKQPQKFTEEGKKAIQEQIVLISTVVSGCARDSYMLMTQGRTPTLPSYLKTNPRVLEKLLKEENKQLCSFMLNEYNTMSGLLSTTDCPSHLLSQDEIKRLAVSAKEASEELQCLICNSVAELRVTRNKVYFPALFRLFGNFVLTKFESATTLKKEWFCHCISDVCFLLLWKTY